MVQSAKLQLRQSQGLALTPQLMQSIKLLQMNSLELNTFVQQEIEKNPLLELDTKYEEFPEERRNQLATGEQPRTANEQSKGKLEPTASGEAKIQEAPLSNHSLNNTASDDYSILETRVANPQTLRQTLTQQAALSFKSNSDLAIAYEIIDLIDDDGYFRFKLSEIDSLANIDLSDAQKILTKIQTFDPPGVGARTLGECLRLQLREKNRLDPVMRIFTSNLELLARRDYPKLAELCQVDMDDLIDMAREIQELEPRPGDVFNTSPVQNVVPDILVKTHNDGSWHIELNQHTLPRVLVNREYYAQIKNLGLKGTDKEFMVDSLQSANWLVASLDQRAQTILKVATEIIKQQDLFFLKGEEHLKPLTLKVVAEQIKMHESTISRVTRNKFLSCERGIFELKYFFMSGIGATDGEATYGRQSIRLKIQAMIANEDMSQILSDEKIASILENEGIKIARRTVMKYRESLGILSSIQRRREKRALAQSKK